jgi:hypothetical protein
MTQAQPTTERVLVTLDVDRKQGPFTQREKMLDWIAACLNCNINHVAVAVEEVRDAPAKDANPLDGFSTQQLVGALIGRGLVVSAWSHEDLDFLDDDDSLEHLSAEELDAAKPLIFERISAGLGDVLGARGNEHLADKWAIEGDAVLAELDIPEA